MGKFLVTGGAGFIGSNTVEGLLQEGHEVNILDNLSEGKIENIKAFEEKVSFVEGDVRSVDDVKEALRGVDRVIHLAALRSVPKSMARPLDYHDVNVTGLLNMLKLSSEAKVRTFVFASSSSVYGEAETFPQKESDPVNPVSPYAATKLIGEQYCRLFANAFGLPTVSLRYFNVFGPKQSLESEYAVAIPKFITTILKNEPPPIYDDGHQSRDFTYVANVVRANISAACAGGVKGEAINVACGNSQTVLGITEEINRILGKDIKPKFLPPRPGDVRKTYADITLLKTKLGINGFVTFEDGLTRTIEWFKKRNG